MLNFNKAKTIISKPKFTTGFTLVEALVGSAVFVILAMSVYQAYTLTMNVVSLSRVKITATALANEQFEIARNLPYADVGIVNGLPLGKIPYDQNLIRDGKEFNIKTTIRNIDDPFDGTIGDTPNDTSPADYKLMELEITCGNCRNFPPMNITSYIAPKALESASTNGALFVKVFDSAGQPIPEADVHIINNDSIPPFEINDVTNNDGLLQIVDAPPGINVYEITVSKDGYSTAQTYTIGDPANPEPSTPHATVVLQELSQVSLVIDKVSTLNIVSTDNLCQAIPNISFSLQGEKTIGTDTYKYSEEGETDNSGEKILTNLETDTYSLSLIDSVYDLAGAIPSTYFILNPDTVQDLKLIVYPKTAKSLLFTVRDSATSLPLADTEVNLVGPEDYNESLITGLGFLRQTDWQGGAGQENFGDKTKYYDADSKIEITDPVGELTLKKILGEYENSAWLISSTFDTGGATNFHQLISQPSSQPAEVESDSVRFQIATNNDKVAWDFLGPDGTTNTFYTTSQQEINSVHDGDRYLRYKVYLQTADTSKTPNISDISFTFTSDCLPPGQVFFSGLLAGNYGLTISKDGYTSYTDTINVNQDWKQIEVILNP